MKLLNLYSRKVSISYRHSICSFAAVYVAVLTTFAIVVPFYVVFSINGDLWATQYQHKMVYEQPVINFQYQYILMAEHRAAAGSQNKVGGILIDDITDAYTVGGGNSVDYTTTAPDNTLIAWSSFDYFNQVMERWQQSVSIKFWKEDYDYDGVIDRMTIQITYEPVVSYNEFKYLSLYLGIEAHVKRHHCELQLPAAIVIPRLFLPTTSGSGELTIEGKMELYQRSAFFCPFFMRNHKSYFYPNVVPANSTNIKDYEMRQILLKLRRNVGYLQFEQKDVHWNTNGGDGKILITLNVDIGEMAARYRTSFWQNVSHIWMQYVSVLIVFVFLIDKLKSWMFGRQMIRAWETIPWKKLY